MKQIFFIALFLLTSCEENQPIENIKDPNIYSIGFGSCLTQKRSMPIFNSIKAEEYDLFLMLGDNVYGDSEREDLLELREAYDLQRQNFDSFNFDFPFEMQLFNFLKHLSLQNYSIFNILMVARP